MLTLIKNFTDEGKTQKKINVKKIVSLKDVINKPIDQLKLSIKNLSELVILSKLQSQDGKTSMFFEIFDGNNKLSFELKDKRKIDYKLLNTLKINENLIQ